MLMTADGRAVKEVSRPNRNSSREEQWKFERISCIAPIKNIKQAHIIYATTDGNE